MKYFNHLLNVPIPKIRKVSKNKVISRTSFISTTIVKNIDGKEPLQQIVTLDSHHISK
jgi:hypothetical protein